MRTENEMYDLILGIAKSDDRMSNTVSCFPLLLLFLMFMPVFIPPPPPGKTHKSAFQYAPGSPAPDRAAPHWLP